MHRIKKITPALCLAVGITLSHGDSAQSQSQNEFLDMEFAQLMQVTITSVSKQEQQLADAAAAIYVVTSDDLHRSGVTSIPEALRMVPGLQVARTGSSKWAVSSRGFNGQFANKLLVLVDGRTIYTSGFSVVYWDTQTMPLENVDRIEVIRGPGASLWGANAVNGVINIITKNSKDTQGGLVTAGVGNIDEAMGTIRYGGELGSAATGRAHLNYSQRDSFDLLDGTDANDDWNSLNGGFRLDGSAGQNTWTLQGDGYVNNENQTVEPFFIPTFPFVTRNQDELDASGWNVLGQWERKLGDGAFKVQAYFDHVDREESYIGQTYNTADLDLQYDRQIGSHSLVFGLGYRYTDTEISSSFMATIPSSREDNLFSGFAQDTITLVDDSLWLTLGAKWEHNDLTGNEVQPSGRIMWKPTERQSVWTSISRAVRTPSFVERDVRLIIGQLPVPSPFPVFTFLNGNPDYDSEELIAYEAGYRWYPADDFLLDVAVFYNDYDELISTRFRGMPPNFTEAEFFNGAEGQSYGLELAVDWKPYNWLQCILAYSYIHLDFEDDELASLFDTGNVVSNSSPRHQVSLRANVDVLENWQANFWLRYVDQIDVASGTAQNLGIVVDDYLELDIALIWKPTENLELQLVGQNLLHSSKLEFVPELLNPPTETERGVFAKLSYTF